MRTVTYDELIAMPSGTIYSRSGNPQVLNKLQPDRQCVPYWPMFFVLQPMKIRQEAGPFDVYEEDEAKAAISADDCD